MLRKILFLVLFIGLSFGAVAPVNASTSVVAGDVSGVWDAAGSPYLVEGDITVPAGATLTIEPGVEVLFQSWYRFTVNGILLAEGTQGAPIQFGGGHATAGWQGIDFINAPDGSRLAHVIVENGRATGASPQNVGGGIYIENSSPEISYSTIRNNFAKSGGGGLYLSGSNAILTGNTIINNSAGQGGSVSGGGIYLVNSNAELNANVIQNNWIYISGSYTTPTGRGGAIFIDHSNPVLRSNLITGNYIDAHLNSNARGGGLYLSVSDPDLINNTISDNSVRNASTGYYSIKEGGGIYASISDPTLVNTVLWNNTPEEIFASSSYSAITAAYSDVQGGQAAIVTNGATINWLDGNQDADPLFVDPSNGEFELAAGSPAIDSGTAHFEVNGRVLVDLTPEAYQGAAPDIGALEYGAGGSANQVPTAIVTIDRDHGSAPLSVQFDSSASFDPDGSIVSTSWDFGDGGTSTEANPVYTYENTGPYQATLTVSDDDGASHSASVAIEVLDGTSIPAGDVSGVWALSGSPYRVEGDIRVPAGETLSIEPGVQVFFEGWNKLTVNGVLQAIGTENEPISFSAENTWLGIRFVDAPDGSVLSNVLVEKGQATGASPENSGGGIYIENSSPMISYSTIRDNRAKSGGGGIYLTGSNAILYGNTILNNTAGQSGGSAFGGGIAILNSTPELTDNIVRGNVVGVAGSYTTPNGYGGGIYANGSNLDLRGNLIAGNAVQASNNSNARGGGIYLSSTPADFVNNTIADNGVYNAAQGYYSIKEGGGIYAAQSTITLVNTILWGNAPEEIFATSNFGEHPLTGAYSDVQGGSAGVVANGVSVNTLGGNINADPLFTDPTSGDYTLASGSPAIDAGTAFFELDGRVLVDLDSGAYLGAAPDMGAFESTQTGGNNLSPIVQASGSPETGIVPLIVQFSSDGSYDPDGSIVAYAWDFGDGSGSTEANPSHTYSLAGVYQVTLTVSDDDGAQSSTMVTVTVDDPIQFEIHVEDQSVSREKFRRNSRGVDAVLITDQNNQPIAGVLVAAAYSGPSQGQVSGTTGADGTAVLMTDFVRRAREAWCFEITSLSADGYVYNPDTNVITIACEAN